eukprot:TRINITY_DN6344_c0_g2_i1.p1 TRINITY_DN6344_c0_g2~~TRINITY_DN6344_c0_g2_i1.p1  ORF type:complete len:377 (-),score=68.61 TRINITY_DN6344_c0_g2_i1:256-1386(-)
MGAKSSKSDSAEPPKQETAPPVVRKPISDCFTEYVSVHAPLDEDGYVQSFSITEEEAYLDFFEQYGFVVVKDVLSADEVRQSIDEVWDFVCSNQWGWDGKKVDRDDPNTWGNDYWPAGRKLGLLGSQEATGTMAWNNRQNSRLYQVYSKLMNMNELWVSVDRWGIMRPTIGVPFKNAETGETERKDMPDWRSAELWLHWDLNPWRWTGSAEGKEYAFEGFIIEGNGSKNDGNLKLQGLVALTDSREDDGGFCTVPGYHKHLKEWSERTKDTDHYANFLQRDFVPVPEGDPMCSQYQKITARPGSLVVWRSEQPHCNFPNRSDRFRINQYVKMFPAQENGKNVDVRQKTVELMTKGKEVTPLGSKLFGLESWKKDGG